MLKKSFILLKNNPLLIVLILLAVAAYAVPTVLFLPETQKMLELSKGFYQNPSAPSADITQMTGMLLSTLKIYLFMLVYGILGVLFLSGYGNMMAAAVNEGKASMKVFLFGIRKFTGKTLLSALLLCALVAGFSIIFSICSTPFIITSTISGRFDYASMMEFQNILQIVVLGISLFLYPLIELWLPAIYLERSDGVFACFRKGIRAGVRNYPVLLAATAALMLPFAILYAFSGDLYKLIYQPSYYLLFVYQAVAIPVILAFLFSLYKGGVRK
jgi:hypothetical protein